MVSTKRFPGFPIPFSFCAEHCVGCMQAVAGNLVGVYHVSNWDTKVYGRKLIEIRIQFLSSLTGVMCINVAPLSDSSFKSQSKVDVMCCAKWQRHARNLLQALTFQKKTQDRKHAYTSAYVRFCIRTSGKTLQNRHAMYPCKNNGKWFLSWLLHRVYDLSGVSFLVWLRSMSDSQFSQCSRYM